MENQSKIGLDFLRLRLSIFTQVETEVWSSILGTFEIMYCYSINVLSTKGLKYFQDKNAKSDASSQCFAMYHKHLFLKEYKLRIEQCQK